ncbi:phosphoglycerate mutase [Martiniozyma asiatica (nom. inval.)]|nr:phosphoglycerate mutase [Martiniozyma asiatica]
MTYSASLEPNDKDKLRIFIVRHGQTDHNLQKILQGHTDIALNATGHKQAELLGESLRHHSWDAILTSDLTRCQETLKEITDLNVGGCPNVEVTSNLRERMMGPVEGMKISDAMAKYGENFKDLGESRKELIARLTKQWHSFVDHCQQSQFKNVLICTHGGVIKTLLAWMEQEAEFEMLQEPIIPFNTSVTVVEISRDGEEKKVCVIGSTRHLGHDNLKADQQAL